MIDKMFLNEIEPKKALESYHTVNFTGLVYLRT